MKEGMRQNIKSSVSTAFSKIHIWVGVVFLALGGHAASLEVKPPHLGPTLLRLEATFHSATASLCESKTHKTVKVLYRDCV